MAKIIRPNDVTLLEVGDSVNHLFKERDKPNVAAVLGFLRVNDIVPYIGLGLLIGNFFKEIKNMGISILSEE